MPKGLNPADINKFARIGAAVRLAELQEEIAALRRAFPGLAAAAPAAKAPVVGLGRITPVAKPARRGRKRPMSAAERRAVSDRMKKYWAERHKIKG